MTFEELIQAKVERKEVACPGGKGTINGIGQKYTYVSLPSNEPGIMAHLIEFANTDIECAVTDTTDQEYIPQPCPHQDDELDCSICGAAAYGGWSWRTCRHGYLRGECSTCDDNRASEPGSSDRDIGRG